MQVGCFATCCSQGFQVLDLNSFAGLASVYQVRGSGEWGQCLFLVDCADWQKLMSTAVPDVNCKLLIDADKLTMPTEYQLPSANPRVGRLGAYWKYLVLITLHNQLAIHYFSRHD